MSNFNCEKCGLPILEGKNGYYITECVHYPIENLKELSMDILQITEEQAKKMISYWTRNESTIEYILSEWLKAGFVREGLKLCPFCGCIPFSGVEVDMCFLECINCDFRIKGLSTKIVLNKWNKRVKHE